MRLLREKYNEIMEAALRVALTERMLCLLMSLSCAISEVCSK